MKAIDIPNPPLLNSPGVAVLGYEALDLTFIEIPDLKYFVATQAHPELKSRMEKPAPLFYGFVKACMS